MENNDNKASEQFAVDTVTRLIVARTEDGDFMVDMEGPLRNDPIIQLGLARAAELYMAQLQVRHMRSNQRANEIINVLTTLAAQEAQEAQEGKVTDA